MAFNRREKRKPGFGDKRLKATICQERSGVAVCSHLHHGSLMPTKRLGNRCFGASLPMRIHASWFGSSSSTWGSAEYKDVAAMIPNGHRPIEAGSASCRAMFLLCPYAPPSPNPTGPPCGGGRGKKK